MLDRLREGIKSIWAKIILGLIIASFVFAGVGSYLTSGGSNAVAIVNGEEISTSLYQQRYQQDKNRIGEQFAQVFNTEAMQKRFQAMVLDRLIMETLAKQANKQLGIFVGREVIKEQIKNTKPFQINGKFDVDTFRNLIGRSGYTASQYEELVRDDMERRQLSAIMDSEFALDSEVSSQLILQGQTRSGRYINIDSSLLQASISFEGEAGEKELEEFYQANLDRFLEPEKISVEYIELNSDSLKVEINDEEIAKYYEAHKSDFGSAEERKASHILIIAAADSDAATLQAAQQKINQIAARIATGEDFATVAKEASEDLASAEEGGDLGFFGTGVMDPVFEKTVFDLAAVNDVSKVVKSSFGFHIIKLTGIKAAEQKPLKEVKEKVIAALKNSKIEELFIQTNDIITEKAFEFTDSLIEVAEASGLEVQVSELFPKTGGKGIFANAAVLEAAYSDQVMVDGYNSDVISVGENHSVVLRLKQLQESRTMAFEEVKAAIEQSLRRERAQLKALEFGEQILAAINNGSTPQQAQALLPETLKASWIEFDEVGRNDATMTQQLRTALFKMAQPIVGPDGSFVKVLKGVPTFNGYSVIQLDRVSVEKAGIASETQRQQVAQQLAKEWSSAEDKAFQDWLLSNADIERFDIVADTQN
jgi:peptidyl-prolyl cis-trans isomerase D